MLQALGVHYQKSTVRKRALVGLDADVRRLLTLYNKQIRVYSSAQSSLLRRIEQSRSNPQWVMPDSVRSELEFIDAFLSRATKSMLELKAATAEANAALDTDALTAQLKEEFLRAMRTYTEDDWAIVKRFMAEREAFARPSQNKGMAS